MVERLCTGRRRLTRSAPLSPKTEAGVTHTHTHFLFLVVVLCKVHSVLHMASTKRLVAGH